MMLALRHQDVKFGFACACSDLQAARDPEPLAPLGFRVKHSGRPFRPPYLSAWPKKIFFLRTATIRFAASARMVSCAMTNRNPLTHTLSPQGGEGNMDRALCALQPAFGPRNDRKLCASRQAPVDWAIQTLYGSVKMKTRTMNISLPQRLVKALDRRAHAEARSRSEVIRAAALSYLQWWEEWRRLQAYGRAQARQRGISPRRLERLIAQVRAERSARR